MIKTSKVTPKQVAAFDAQQARIREQLGFAAGEPVVRRGLDEFKDGGKADDAMLARAARLSTDMHGSETDDAAGVTTIGVTQSQLDTYVHVDLAVPGTDTTVVAMPPELAVLSVLQPQTVMLLRLVIAHDGSLAAALSKAIVARAEQIGLQALVNASPPSMRPKE